MTAAATTDSLWRRLCYTRLRDVLRGRLDARLDWRQTIALAELPDSLADATGQVVRRTRLWRGEKVDVANDLIAHFQDGLAFGHAPDELLKTFGDQTAAAKLIRRAKRRSRSFAWHVWHYGWMCFLALVGAYTVMGLWMSMGRPTIRIDYLAGFNQAPLAVPENERAWPVYRDALLTMGFAQKEGDSPAKNVLADDAKPGDKNWKEAESFLNGHAESIAKLREAANRPSLGFVSSTTHADFTDKDRELFGVKLKPEEIEAARHQTLQDRWLVSALLPELQYLKDSALLLASDARRAALAGDGSTAYADVVALLGISRHCEEMPFLVCLLVAEAVQQSARSAIHDILTEHSELWTDGQLRDLAHKMAATRIDWVRGFVGERTCFYDSIQRMYTDNGSGDGRLALQVSHDQNLFQLLDAISGGGNSAPSIFANMGVAMFTLPAANMIVASRKDMIDLHDRISNHVLAKIQSPLWKQSKETSLDDEMRAIRSDPLGKFRYLFVELLVPAFDKLWNKIIVSDGERDGVFVGLALELYHRKHSKWPESLAELSPQWLPQLPVDAITGQPLHYKVVDDRPVVYSVGADGDDDGGRRVTDDSALTLVPKAPTGSTPDDGDWVIWSTGKRN
jgi:hypothetical protein